MFFVCHFNINPCHSLFFGRDHLRSNIGITCGPGSFAVQFGDHLRSGIICGPGIICGLVQHSSKPVKSSPNSCKFSQSSTKTPKRVDEEVGTFLNVFPLRPDKLARSCEITAHVKFIKTQIPNISSFFFFFKCGNSLRWANLINFQGPVSSTTSLSSNIMHSLTGIYLTTKWSSGLLGSSSLQRIHGELENFWADLF